jgi:hypothetical protein
MVKRRRSREHDEADAREQADRRRDALIAELKARQGLGRHPESPIPADTPSSPADAPATDAAEPEPG